MDENFSPRVKDVIQFSKEEAIRLGNKHIGTEHLLLGLIREGEGMAIDILLSLGVDVKLLRKRIEDVSNSEISVNPTKTPNLSFSTDSVCSTSLNLAKRGAGGASPWVVS